MIELIQSGIGDVSSNMVECQQYANTSVEHVEQAGQSLASIASSIDEINDMSLQIATAAEEQSCVSDEISKSIVTISDVANESTSGAQNLALAGARLSAMSKEMRLVIQRYNIDEEQFNKSEESQRLLKWQHSFEIGIEEADRQHRKMIDLMNDVHIMSAQSRSPHAIARALNVLIEYTKVHFSWEENLFDSHGYQKSAEHKETHKNLVDELIAHKEKIALADIAEIDKEMEQLNTWLLHHIEYSDSDYAEHINGNKVVYLDKTKHSNKNSPLSVVQI
jgi:methyl-accepting chemotaxis protein/hemerythrin